MKSEIEFFILEKHGCESIPLFPIVGDNMVYAMVRDIDGKERGAYLDLEDLKAIVKYMERER